MTEGPADIVGLAWTLQDAVALSDAWGPGVKIALGVEPGDADVYAPAGLTLDEAEARHALQARHGGVFLSLGNQAEAPDLAAIAPIFERLLASVGTGFMALCLAEPAYGRSVFQGHLFQAGRLLGEPRRLLSERLAGRVGVLPYEVVAAGGGAIRARLAALREQGTALVLLDAAAPEHGDALATALAGQLATAGPAWLSPSRRNAAKAPSRPAGRLAILSGALDRQTLFQLGAARAKLPFLQLDFSRPDVTAQALAWAAAQGTTPVIICASAPPNRLHDTARVREVLGEIAAGLAACGITRFVVTGNDTAAGLLRDLGIRSIVTGAKTCGLRWVSSGRYSFLLKPGGFGPRDLFLDGFEPQIRLNAAAE